MLGVIYWRQKWHKLTKVHQQKSLFYSSELPFIAGLNFPSLDRWLIWVLTLPSSLTSDVLAIRIEWGWLKSLLGYESNLSPPYPGLVFTFRLVRFGGLIWLYLSGSCIATTTVTKLFLIFWSNMIGAGFFIPFWKFFIPWIHA